MSTSLLYHAFGIRGYRYVRTRYPSGETIFAIEQPTEALKCSVRGSRDVCPRGHVGRAFRSLPIGS